MKPAEIYLPDVHGDASFLILDVTRNELSSSYFNHFDREFIAANSLPMARQQEWLWGRYTLKRLLEKRFHLAPQELEIGSRQQRPHVKELAISVSVSHTKEFVMAGASWNHVVGVDIERHEPRSSRLQAIRSVCSDVELAQAQHLQNCKREEDALYLLWCTKEACVKSGVARSVFALKSNSFSLISQKSLSWCETFLVQATSVECALASCFFSQDFYAAFMVASR